MKKTKILLVIMACLSLLSFANVARIAVRLDQRPGHR